MTKRSPIRAVSINILTALQKRLTASGVEKHSSETSVIFDEAQMTCLTERRKNFEFLAGETRYAEGYWHKRSQLAWN